MTTMAKAIRVKDTAFGQDMLEVLAERQLERIGYQELDIAHSIQTLKEYLVKKLSHGNWRVDPGLCQPELRYLYPVYFDSARVLLAECVAEFFQNGKITSLRRYATASISTYRPIISQTRTPLPPPSAYSAFWPSMKSPLPSATMEGSTS